MGEALTGSLHGYLYFFGLFLMIITTKMITKPIVNAHALGSHSGMSMVYLP